MMEAIVIHCESEELITCSPTITKSYVYNSGHITITIRSGSPKITHNVIRARPDMNFPGFEYGAIAVDFFAKPIIEHNFIECGLPVEYDGYDIWGRYHKFIEGSGLIMHAYFGASILNNTFYNCGSTGIEVNPYLWHIENNNFIGNKVNLVLFDVFEPEPSDVWQQKLLENYTITPLKMVSVTNNYWGTIDEDQVRRLIVIHGTTKIDFKPFKISFIREALPNWKEFWWKGARAFSIVSCYASKTMLALGERVTITGTISPSHEATVILTYKMPNGTILTRNVTSTALGKFMDEFVPDIVGSWTVKARWEGDLDHEGDESREASFIVLRTKSSLSILLLKKLLVITRKLPCQGLLIQD